ncbi:hypothetical protein [Colwellia piezophila]|uniref:hypothetical protein n=1 Tax=Colwellia piezophila TaxID=211668 RepID=UPI00036E2856|nr:hypothetical protein [Colwellia piezophila]
MTQVIKKKILDIETLYEQQIKKARQASRNLTGYERAIKICAYFESVGHPHPDYTFNQLAMNRYSDRQFAIDLMKNMAYLVAVNLQIESFA